VLHANLDHQIQNLHDAMAGGSRFHAAGPFGVIASDDELIVDSEKDDAGTPTNDEDNYLEDRDDRDDEEVKEEDDVEMQVEGGDAAEKVIEGEFGGSSSPAS
jgi:hypothetical protein